MCCVCRVLSEDWMPSNEKRYNVHEDHKKKGVRGDNGKIYCSIYTEVGVFAVSSRTKWRVVCLHQHRTGSRVFYVPYPWRQRCVRDATPHAVAGCLRSGRFQTSIDTTRPTDGGTTTLRTSVCWYRVLCILRCLRRCGVAARTTSKSSQSVVWSCWTESQQELSIRYHAILRIGNINTYRDGTTMFVDTKMFRPGIKIMMLHIHILYTADKGGFDNNDDTDTDYW